MTFWPRHSNEIFEGKITFIVGISNFVKLCFKRYIFKLCGKIIVHEHFKVAQNSFQYLDFDGLL